MSLIWGDQMILRTYSSHGDGRCRRKVSKNMLCLHGWGSELSTSFFHSHFIGQGKSYVLVQYQWGRKFISPLVELQNHMAKMSTGRGKELGTILNLPQLASTMIVVSHSSDGTQFFRKGELVQLQSLPLSLRTAHFWISSYLSGHSFSVLFSGSAFSL